MAKRKGSRKRQRSREWDAVITILALLTAVMSLLDKLMDLADRLTQK